MLEKIYIVTSIVAWLVVMMIFAARQKYWDNQGYLADPNWITILLFGTVFGFLAPVLLPMGLGILFLWYTYRFFVNKLVSLWDIYYKIKNTKEASKK